MLLWFKDWVRWLFWFPSRRVLEWMPLALAYWIGTGLGFVFYFFARERRNRTKQEIRSLTFAKKLNEQTIRKITRRAIVNLILNKVDLLLYEKLAKIPIEIYAQAEGLKYLNEARSQNKGVILVHTHFGNPQILMAALGWRNYPVNQIGREPKKIRKDEDVQDPNLPLITPVLERVLNLIHKLERILPAKFIYIHETLLPAFRCLKKNEIVAIAIDGLGGGERMNVTVHGRQVSFSTAPVAMALRTGAVLLPAFVLRIKPNYQHKLIIEPPLNLQSTGDEVNDLKIYTQKIADRLAEYLIRYPCQYARLFGYKRPYFIENSDTKY